MLRCELFVRSTSCFVRKSYIFAVFIACFKEIMKIDLLSAPCTHTVLSVCDMLEIYAAFKAAKSVTFDLLILEIKFLLFKNTVKILKFR